MDSIQWQNDGEPEPSTSAGNSSSKAQTEDPSEVPSETLKAEGNSSSKAQTEGRSEVLSETRKAEGIDPNIVEKALSDKKCENKGGFDSHEDRLRYVCQNHGLQFRPLKSTGFFEAVCDQQVRMFERKTKQTSEEDIRERSEKHDSYSARWDLVKFLEEPKNRKYKAMGRDLSLEEYLPGKKEFKGWLNEVKHGTTEIDHVTVIAMAMCKQQNILLITSAASTSEGTLDENNTITIIPGLNGRRHDIDIDKDILLGYYGKSCFRSLEPILDLKMALHSKEELSRQIELKLHLEQGIDPDIVKRALTTKYCLNTSKEHLKYVCRNHGLKFRHTNESFFEAVCDQQIRIQKNVNEQQKPESLRKELAGFLQKTKEYETRSGVIDLEEHIPGEQKFGDWLEKLKDGTLEVDHVVMIAMAMCKRQNILLITNGPSKPDGTLDLHNTRTIIPGCTGRPLNFEKDILIGCYGTSHFRSLEPKRNSKVSPIIRSPDETVDVKKSLEKQPDNEWTTETKKFGIMAVQKGDQYQEINPSTNIYRTHETNETFPCPVVSYVHSEGELTIKWRWHNDTRHVVTTILVIGRKFLDRSGVNWCDSKIVENDENVDVRQCFWKHNRADNQDQQRIDCLLPCVNYRIVVVDHFQKILHSDTIERTASQLLHYTPAPTPLELLVTDNYHDEELEFEWRLKDELSAEYIDVVELLIQNRSKKHIHMCEKPQKPDGKLARHFTLKNINEHIKVNIRVKTEPYKEVGYLSDQVELVIVHPPKPRCPPINKYIFWRKMKNMEKCLKFRNGEDGRISKEIQYETETGNNTETTTNNGCQAIIEMHKLQCGALACQRSSVTERISPGPSSPRTPIPDKPDVPTKKTVDVTPSPMGNSPLPSPPSSVHIDGPITPLSGPEHIASTGSELCIPLRCFLRDDSVIISLNNGIMIDKKSTREGEGTPKKQIDKEEKKKNERKRAEEERWENERKRAEEERWENERKRAEEERWENERKRAEEERWENERKRAEEEQRRRDNESDRKKREKKRKKQEEFRKDGETHRSYEERQREREEERRIQNEKRREDKMRKVIQLYRPPKFTTIKSSPRRRAAKGYFRILWRRPVMHNEGMMYLSPYLR